jgi:hypothetical protein
MQTRIELQRVYDGIKAQHIKLKQITAELRIDKRTTDQKYVAALEDNQAKLQQNPNAKCSPATTIAEQNIDLDEEEEEEEDLPIGEAEAEDGKTGPGPRRIRAQDQSVFGQSALLNRMHVASAQLLQVLREGTVQVKHLVLLDTRRIAYLSKVSQHSEVEDDI